MQICIILSLRIPMLRKNVLQLKIEYDVCNKYLLSLHANEKVLPHE